MRRNASSADGSLLPPYVLGKSTTSDTEELEEHILWCPACLAKVRKAELALRALRLALLRLSSLGDPRFGSATRRMRVVANFQ